MVPTVLTPDSKLSFPDFTLLRASAGSGKTRALSHRYMQFLLSDTIQKNSLTNILAITFSNNAAREMKYRILTWLKAIYAGNEEHLDVLQYLTGAERDVLKERAGKLVDHIIENYSDFQVRTIDSFTASVFRSSALEFGISPGTEILLQKNQLIDLAFENFFRNVRPDSDESILFERIVDHIDSQKRADSRFMWDPTVEIISVFKKLYGRLSSIPGVVKPEDFTGEISRVFSSIKEHIIKIDEFISANGLEYNRSARFDRALDAVTFDDRDYVLGRQHKSNIIKKGAMEREEFEKWNSRVNELRNELNALYARLTEYYARSYFNPHLVNFHNFGAILHSVKRDHNQIFIDDIGKLLISYLEEQIVPYVYLMLGDTIHHYLIDEFQDTSPLQWADLKPLIENSLSEGGSLFAVGDTKQAIYKFRGADFKIMKQLEAVRVFPSASATVKDLAINYRSDENILRFNEAFFNALLEHKEYGPAARLSGLDNHLQKPSEKKKNIGYAESIVIWPEDRKEDTSPERKIIIDTIDDVLRRGYNHRDIAILTFKNNDVSTISSWLSESKIRFISFSNLDVRNRKITGELISLLRFLNSPVDDLAFASFCLGDICEKQLGRNNIPTDEFIQFMVMVRNNADTRNHPLYKSFQQRYPEFWERYFEQLFNRVGYLSIYDLTLDIYKTFSLYDSFSEEEASLTKFIEAMKDFESGGINSLRAFLDHSASEDSESEWNLDTPEKIDAVQLMTIHKAKGLGFPVVIIVLYTDHRMKEDFYVDDSDGIPRLLYLNKEYAEVDPSLGRIYDAHRFASIADYLNGLYVACTRAGEEMYLIGIPPRNTGKDSIFSLIPSVPHGRKIARPLPPESDEKLITAFHHNLPAHFGFGDRLSLNISEMQRGELIHEILSRIEFTDTAPAQILTTALERYQRICGAIDGIIPDEIIETLTVFLNYPEVKKFYSRSEGRRVMTETEISDPAGRLYRVDRIVIDRSDITVIDFKTGDDREHAADHDSQIRTYMKLLGEIYPDRSIRGIIAYVDKNRIRVME
jgi:ATP-dependent helicase/nuclease subunit A